jgi:hypothetical protein
MRDQVHLVLSTVCHNVKGEGELQSRLQDEVLGTSLFIMVLQLSVAGGYDCDRRG